MGLVIKDENFKANKKWEGHYKVYNKKVGSLISLIQACQTGGPRAACGPIKGL